MLPWRQKAIKIIVEFHLNIEDRNKEQGSEIPRLIKKLIHVSVVSSPLEFSTATLFVWSMVKSIC